MKSFEKSNKVLAELKRLHDYINDNLKYFKRLKEFKRDECLGIYDYDSTDSSKQLIIETVAFNHIINGGRPIDYFSFSDKAKDEKNNIDIGSNLGSKLIRAWKLKGYVVSGGSHGKTIKSTSGRTIGGKQRQVYIIDFKELENI
jgi:hypothetical protein